MLIYSHLDCVQKLLEIFPNSCSKVTFQACELFHPRHMALVYFDI